MFSNGYRVDNQLDAPFSADVVIALRVLLGSLTLSSVAAAESCSLQIVRALFLALICSALVSGWMVLHCCRMRATSGAVILFDWW